jgi:hypothetical protein
VKLTGRICIIQHHDRTSNASTPQKNLDVLIAITSHDSDAVSTPKTHFKHGFGKHLAAIGQLAVRQSYGLPWEYDAWSLAE